MNTVDYIRWTLNESGLKIKDEIILVMGDRSIEFRETSTNKLIDCEIDSTEYVLEWLTNNNMLEPTNYLTTNDYKIAEQNGIIRQTAYDRVYKYGWDKQDAITKPPKQTKRFLNPEHIKIAKNNGIERRVLSHRIKLGWSVEKATTEPIMGKKKEE